MRRAAQAGVARGARLETDSSNPGKRAAERAFELGPAFHAVFESSGEPLLLVDDEYVIHSANCRASGILQLRGVEPANENLNDFFSEPIRGLLSRAVREGSESSYTDATLRSGFRIRVIRRASLVALKLHLICLEEGSLVQRAESKWRFAEAEIAAILDSVRVGILLLDAGGKVRHTNARFGQLFSLDASNLRAIETADDIRTFLAPRFESADSFLARWNAFIAGEGEPAHDELEIMRPSPRVLERFSRPVLDAENRKIGWAEIYYDVTGDRQLQSKLLQTEKMAALGHLVSGIAHELNNPLTAIMGYAQLLLSHGLRAEHLGEARNVFDEAERATRIVKNLLYFARENKPERTHVNLNEIVERALALRSYELKVQNIIVECLLAPDLPLTLADPHQLQQAVLNLVVNAEQALVQSRGKGKIWIRTRPVTGTKVALEVSDDGPGIPKEIASRIFEPFFTTKPPGVGTGLGLSIVYGIVHQHDGEVTLESRIGGGATFVIELPITAHQLSATNLLPASAAEPLARAPASRILVVEDEPTIAQLVVDVLREEGHQVDAVLDSQEGLTRLSRGRYDLVVCDLRMPRLDGPAFYDALVRSGSPLVDHIIFITGDTLAPRTASFLEATGVPYLAKPFLVEELRLAVNRRLAQPAAKSGVLVESAAAKPSRVRAANRKE
jgi:signal transduction histidine kinase/FixJ family two-component response regulator